MNKDTSPTICFTTLNKYYAIIFVEAKVRKIRSKGQKNIKGKILTI